MKYDFSVVEFLSSPIQAVSGDYDTRKYCRMSVASFGSANIIEVEDNFIYFR